MVDIVPWNIKKRGNGLFIDIALYHATKVRGDKLSGRNALSHGYGGGRLNCKITMRKWGQVTANIELERGNVNSK